VASFAADAQSAVPPDAVLLRVRGYFGTSSGPRPRRICSVAWRP